MGKTWEVEQKYCVPNRPALAGRLAELGFQLRNQEEHRDVYLRHPSRNLRETDEAFRIRARGDSACVTYKGPRLAGAIKTRQEIELEIRADDVDQWLTMYQQLGFEPVPEVRKTRCNYQRNAPNSALVTIDDVEQLGTFSEIELIVDDTEQIDAAQQTIEELADQLGLSDVQPKSYISLLLAKLGVE